MNENTSGTTINLMDLYLGTTMEPFTSEDEVRKFLIAYEVAMGMMGRPLTDEELNVFYA